MNYEQAIEQLKEQIAAKGKFSLQNIPDYALGVATANKQELQGMLDKLLERKGIMTPDDEVAIAQLLDKQKQARKERTKIIVRNTLIAVGTVATGVAFWFTFKSKKK